LQDEAVGVKDGTFVLIGHGILAANLKHDVGCVSSFMNFLRIILPIGFSR